MKNCNGIVFKASIQNYKTEKGCFGFKVILTPVKRKSCPGCKNCLWQSDSFGEVGNNWPIKGIENCKDGKYYKISTCNHSTDFETGHLDYWDLCLIELYEDDL